ncbi:MAG: hypothetical protein IPM79_25045 [Polyangiaceae bacterium]|jgi:hypothetical protein|nr:hypothetical protein [Polyangiaceae bacterium]MBK8940793.1 hypothetical protein [Polyangiaceae bacterium]
MLHTRHALAFLLTTTVSLLACSERPTSLLDGDGGSDGAGGSASGSGGDAQGAGGSGSGGDATGSGGDGGAGPQPATFEISIGDPSPAIELRDSVEIDVTVTPNGYVGAVNFLLDGLPADLDAGLDTTTVTLDGTSTETLTLTITSFSNTVTGDHPYDVTGTVEGGTQSAGAAVTVLPIITITIPQNLASYSSDPPDETAFGDYPTVIKAPPGMSAANPVTVNFFNADSVSHEIHADYPDQGFPHGNQGIPPMSLDPLVREVNSPGLYNYYPHDINDSIRGRILIEP